MNTTTIRWPRRSGPLQLTFMSSRVSYSLIDIYLEGRASWLPTTAGLLRFLDIYLEGRASWLPPTAGILGFLDIYLEGWASWLPTTWAAILGFLDIYLEEWASWLPTTAGVLGFLDIYLEGWASWLPTTAAILGFLESPTGGWVTSAPRNITGSLNTWTNININLYLSQHYQSIDSKIWYLLSQPTDSLFPFPKDINNVKDIIFY